MNRSRQNHFATTALAELSLTGPQYGANAAGLDANADKPRYVRITDIDDNGNLHSEGAKSADFENTADYTLTEGDLLFARSGNTVGKTYLYRPEDGHCTFAGYLIRFRLNQKKIIPKLAFYYTKSIEYKNWVASRQRTGGQPNINGQEYSALEVPHPTDLREQARIVELLDQADALRRQRAEADAKLARLLPALFRHHFGDPDTNPRDWANSTIGDVLEDSFYGLSLSASAEPRGTPFLRMNNIRFDGSLDLERLKYVELSEVDLAKNLLRDGDILFNRTNSADLVGKTGLWREQFPAVAASYLIILRVDRSRVEPAFVWAWMNTPSFKSILHNRGRRAIGMANINSTELRSFPLFVPPLDQQRSFVAQAKATETLLAQAAASAAKLETLFQTLLHRAFTGELTARWREAHLHEGVQELTRLSRA